MNNVREEIRIELLEQRGLIFSELDEKGMRVLKGRVWCLMSFGLLVAMREVRIACGETSG